MIKMSIVICTFNRCNLLIDCLKSICEQTLDNDVYEVVIVDNNSTDSTFQSARSFCENKKNFKLFFEEKQGHSQARNRGWQEAVGTYVAYLDDDCLADNSWAERILRAFEDVHPKPVAVGGTILPRYEVEPPVWFPDLLEIRSWGDQSCFLKQPLGKYGFSGANMAFSREVLEKFDGFSRHFGIVEGALKMGEDTEFFLRLSRADLNLFWYDPAITVYHWTPRLLFLPSYRLKRSFLSGRSHIGFEEGLIDLGYLSRVLISIPVQLMKLMGFIVQPSGQKTGYALQSVEKAVHQAGLLVEAFKIVLPGRE